MIREKDEVIDIDIVTSRSSMNLELECITKKNKCFESEKKMWISHHASILTQVSTI